MRRHTVGWTLLLAVALAIPTIAASPAIAGKPKAAKSDDAQGASASDLSKEDQEKLREHNKLRAEIKKVKYPAPKSEIVAKVKGLKPDDKKWFEQTLPDRTYNSADEVYNALGWETNPPEPATKTK